MFQNLVSLKTVVVYDCPTIVDPHMDYLKSLVSLELCDCPNLISLKGLSELNDLKALHKKNTILNKTVRCCPTSHPLK